MNYHSGDSLVINKGDNVENFNAIDSLSIMRDQAWAFSDIRETLDFFNSMYDNYNDSIALFNSAYIYDQFLYDIENAASVYYKLQDKYPSHPKLEYIDNRLTQLDTNISTLISENNQKINIYDAYNLIKSNSLDSAKKKFENIEINRRDAVFHTIRDLIDYIDSYTLMQQEYNKKEELLKDSLIFHMAKIDYYYFNRTDKAFSSFKNIVKEFPNSNYVNQSFWILRQTFDEYKQDTIQYESIDTSSVSFYNPINDWDIKEIKNEYKELNNLYDNFKDKIIEDED